MQKKIFSCWFGGKKKDGLSNVCLKSWRKNLSQYNFFEFTENNFDYTKHHYTQKAYEKKQWAFLSDYVRIWGLYHEGGIYLDTDIELIKGLDYFLENRVFLGFADEKNIGTAVIGGEKGHPFFKSILEYYDKAKQGSGNNKIITDILYNYGLPKNRDIKKTYHLQEGIVIYPKEYFEPIDYNHRHKTPEENKKHYVTQNSYTIHYSKLSRITNRMRCKHYVGIGLEKIGLRKPIKKVLIKLGILDPKVYGYE
ncbi:hypothetical protein XF24_00542 [candidate division SR1 bacterium Aalborg_AAW-1]|nr:hypothetical protein XF24_00542 [candidate division SR1 bacterium Aalborg_AAW-1]